VRHHRSTSVSTETQGSQTSLPEDNSTMRAYKFRLYPNKRQHEKLWAHANRLNSLYNYFLTQKIEAYKKDKTNITKNQQQAELTQMKKTDETLKVIHSQVLQQVTFRLDRTYQDFFKRGFGFPSFRSCRNFFGITYPQSGYQIKSDNTFVTRAYGTMNFHRHREVQGRVRQVSITCQDGNKWFLIIITDYDPEKTRKPNDIIGIDVGVTNLVALSNGEIIKNKRHAKYFDKQINDLKSKRDKNTKKKSRRNRSLSRVIRRLYGTKNRKIKDFLHKVSHDLSSSFDTIIIEDLNLKYMSESNETGLNRGLRNSQLAQFTSYLEYKTNRVVKVPPYNTSKTCNSCGKIHEMPLSQRVMKCSCGHTEDRDVNAAKNIFCLGRAILEKGCADILLSESLCL